MLLKCENLTLGYGSAVVAENISFEVNAGDYVCVVGENGAGKSTLIKTLLSLMKPVAGTVEFSETVARSSIGYLPQKTEAQKDFPASIWEVVLSGCLCHAGFRPFYSKEEKNLARRNLELLGISSLAQKSFRSLSGGQQQRVLLARALCATDRLLILDEPTTGLDVLATGELYAIVRGLNKSGSAIIMASHDIENCAKDASHILHIANSSHFYGTTAEYAKSGFAFAALAGAET